MYNGNKYYIIKKYVIAVIECTSIFFFFFGLKNSEDFAKMPKIMLSDFFLFCFVQATVQNPTIVSLKQ